MWRPRAALPEGRFAHRGHSGAFLRCAVRAIEPTLPAGRDVSLIIGGSGGLAPRVSFRPCRAETLVGAGATEVAEKIAARSSCEPNQHDGSQPERSRRKACDHELSSRRRDRHCPSRADRSASDRSASGRPRAFDFEFLDAEFRAPITNQTGPMPLPFPPPNGNLGRGNVSLMPTMRYSSASATRQMRRCRSA